MVILLIHQTTIALLLNFFAPAGPAPGIDFTGHIRFYDAYAGQNETDTLHFFSDSKSIKLVNDGTEEFFIIVKDGLFRLFNTDRKEYVEVPLDDKDSLFRFMGGFLWYPENIKQTKVANEYQDQQIVKWIVSPPENSEFTCWLNDAAVRFFNEKEADEDSELVIIEGEGPEDTRFLFKGEVVTTDTPDEDIFEIPEGYKEYDWENAMRN